MNLLDIDGLKECSKYIEWFMYEDAGVFDGRYEHDIV